MFLIYSTESVCTTGNDINEYAHEREKKSWLLDEWCYSHVVLECPFWFIAIDAKNHTEDNF